MMQRVMKSLPISLVPLAIMVAVVQITIVSSCYYNHFDCGKGQCIPLLQKCDGVEQCYDGADEKGCNVTTKCDGFQCQSGKCIRTIWKCDGDSDCEDDDDEKNCDAPAECHGFRCRTGQCISMHRTCDGTEDCKDSSDENKCDFTNVCFGFQCEDGFCIETHRKCDGLKDCTDGSDEDASVCTEGIPNHQSSLYYQSRGGCAARCHLLLAFAIHALSIVHS